MVTSQPVVPSLALAVDEDGPSRQDCLSVAGERQQRGLD